MHCLTKKLIQAQKIPAVKIELGWESLSPPKKPFSTKIDKQSTWQASILLKNPWRFFFALYRGTLR